MYCEIINTTLNNKLTISTTKNLEYFDYSGSNFFDSSYFGDFPNIKEYHLRI